MPATALTLRVVFPAGRGFEVVLDLSSAPATLVRLQNSALIHTKALKDALDHLPLR